MQTKRIINFRVLFFAFTAYLFAILFGYEILSLNIIYIAFFALMFGALLTFSIIRKKLLEMTMVFIFLTLGFASFFVEYNHFTNLPTYDSPQTVTARVTDVYNYSYYQKITLKNVTISQNKSYNILLKVNGGTLQVGDQITFTQTLKKEELFELGSFNYKAYSNKTLYSSTISMSDITNQIQTNLTLQEQIRLTYRQMLYDYMPAESAELAYSSIFGDRTGLDYNTYTAFSTSGVAHVLSVSGMHVAFLVLVASFILKKLKFGPKTRFFIFAALLLFYCYICGFKLTVIRASIMSLALLLSNITGKQYDPLNSIAIAGFLILFINPLSALDIGFKLSFLAVLIIAMFMKPVKNYLIKIKLPKKVASLIALTFCLQIGLLPIMAQYFGTFSLLSIITNLLVIPIFEIAFISTLCTIIIVSVFPFLGFLLTFESFLFDFVIQVASFISGLSFANISIFETSSIITTVLYIALFVLSGFVMAKFKHKAYIFTAIFTLVFTFTLIGTIPTNYNNLTIMQINTYSQKQTLICSQSGEKTLIGNFEDLEHINMFLQRAKIDSVDNLIITTQTSPEFLASFKNKYNVKKAVYFGSCFETQNTSANFFYYSTNNQVLNLTVDGHNILYINNQVETAQNNLLEQSVFDKNFNIIINSNLTTANLQTDFCVTPDSLSTNMVQYNSLNNWLFSIKNGKLFSIRSIT